MTTRIDAANRASLAALILAAGAPCALAQTRVNSVSASHAPFTVVGLPDTQNYSEFYPEIFDQQTRWVVENRARRNIAFVSHYGDVVNHGDSITEWENAEIAMRRLDNANIPYGVSAGNHDITPAGTAGTAYIPHEFRTRYGPERFAGKSWYGGASPSGMSSYQTFSGGGKEFIALHLICDTPLDELVWAQGVLNANRDKPVMITTHRYLQDAEDYTGGVPLVSSGRYPDIWYNVEGTYTPGGIHAEAFYETFVRTNPNVFLVNSGHFHEEYRQTSTNLAGLPVHEVLADYQDDTNGGNGFLRLMQFDTARNRIDVQSYSPYLDAYETKDESQFTLSVDFDRYASATPVSVFQQGIGAYEGTRDTWLSQDAPNSSFGNNGTIVVDDDTTNSIFSDRRGQGLLKFEGAVTPDGASGSVPEGATILSATLRLWVTDDADTPFADPDFDVYMMTRDWDESSTWNSMNGGLNAGEDLGLLLGRLAGDNNPDSDGVRVLDVTDAVQMWASGLLGNFGFALMPEIISGNDDGMEIASSEYFNTLLRPALEIAWTMPGRTVPAPGTAAAIALSALLSARRRR